MTDIETPQTESAQDGLLPREDRLDAYKAIWENEENSGEAAYTALAEVENLIMEDGGRLDEDEGYVWAGFAGRADYQDALAFHAAAQAHLFYESSRDKADWEWTLDNIGEHAADDMESAWLWIKKSGARLFEEEIYTALDTDRASFIDEMVAAHVDAVASKIRLARELQTSGENDEMGYALIQDILTDHFPALGVTGLDQVDTQSFGGYEQVELDELDRHFSVRMFRASIAQARANNPQNSPFIKPEAKPVLDAHKIARDCATFVEAKDAFDGTGYTADGFLKEVERSTVVELTRILVDLTAAENKTRQGFAKALDDIADLRGLFDAAPVSPQGDVPIAMRTEDFWMSDVLAEFQYRSFTHLMESLKIAGAGYAVNNLSARADDFDLLTQHEELLEAEQMLVDAYFATDDAAEMNRIGINLASFEDALVEAAPYAIGHYANLLRSAVVQPADKRVLLANISGEYHRLAKLDAAVDSPMTLAEISQLTFDVSRRYAAECLGDAMTAYAPQTHESLAEVEETLTALELDVFAPEFLEVTGMNDDMAAHVQDTLTLARWTKMWQDVNADDLFPEEIVQARFERMEKLRDDMRETGSPELDIEFAHTLGAGDLREIDIFEKDIARDFYKERREYLALFNDASLESQKALEDAKKCIAILHPQALESDVLFSRFVGGSRAGFLALEQKITAAAVQKRKALNVSFYEAGGPAAQLAAIVKGGLEPAVAYDRLADLSRYLRAEGRSLADADVLAPSGLDVAGLQAFKDDLCLRQAREYAMRADAKKGMPVTLASVSQHAFQDYRIAQEWVSNLSGPTVLHDDHWRALGYADRADYITQIGTALLDLTGQMERALDSEGMLKGPLALVNVLCEIRMAYGTAGLEEDRDMTPRGEYALDLNPAAIQSIRRGQDILARVAVPAWRQIADEKRPLSWRYKQINGLLSFMIQMNVNKPQDVPDVGKIYDALHDVVFHRITVAVKNYKKTMRRPSVSARLASAIKKLVDTQGLAEKPWLTEVANDIGFENFAAFADYAATSRLNELGLRVFKRVNDMTDEERKDPRSYWRIWRDMAAFQALSEPETGLITGQRRNEQLENLGFEPEPNWLLGVRKVAAMMVLPLMVRQLNDPLLSDGERMRLFMQCGEASALVGEVGKSKLSIDWNAFEDVLQTTLTRQIAGILASDAMRGPFDRLSVHTMSVYEEVQAAGYSFADVDFMASLGLKDDEIRALAELEKLMPAYIALTDGIDMAVQRGNVLQLFGTILEYFNAGTEGGFDVRADDTLKKLGVSDPAPFRKWLDSLVLEVAAGACNELDELEAKDAEGVKRHLKGMIGFMRVTGIQDRLGADGLHDKGILSIEEMSERVKKLEMPVLVKTAQVISLAARRAAAPVRAPS